jgi:hypothetical protein
MSSSQAPTSPPASPEDIFERLADQYRTVAYLLFGLGVAMLAFPITNVVLYRWQSLAFLCWGGAVAMYLIAAGIVCLVMESPVNRRAQADRLRITVLVVLGGVGLMTALLGLLLPFSTPPASLTNYQDIFGGGVKAWRQRENAWPLVRLAAALIGGLVLMFLGLIQARTFERTRPNLRRLLYGYNAIFSSVLLVLIIGLLNLLPYSGVRPFSYANESIDWTRAGIHSLHPATKNLLSEMKEPAKVYLLGSSSDRVMFEMKTLLEKCQAIDPQLTWAQLSRDRNRSAVAELMEKYQIPESEGVLVVYGTAPNEVTDFIKSSDLFETNMADETGRRFVFKGENALLNSLTFLSAGKTKATVYFTQGNGELAFGERRADRIDVGMGALIDELNRANYAPRELNVTADTDKIPEDADIVVVARPREEVPAKFLTALRDYLNGTSRKDKKKGKLVVLFDVVQRGGKGAMVRTGLEALVAEHGVRVGDNELLDPSNRREPLALTALTNGRGKNPVARAFANETEGATPFIIYKARTVEPSKANPPGAPAAETAETLLMTYPIHRILVETDLDASPRALIEELLRSGPEKINEKLSRAPLSLAVTVSEGKTAAPPIPGHDFMAKEGQPRMVVFGDATWISNSLLQQGAPFHFNLFTSCLSWLVERSDIGTRVPATQHDVYRLKAPPGSSLRLLLLPGFLMMLGVLALGVGVWVVRRR